jgi:hypothetical protein
MSCRKEFDMTILERLDNYGCYILPAGQRIMFVKNGTNPVHYVTTLKLNIRQANKLVSEYTRSIELLEVNKTYMFYGVTIEIVNNLNDNLFWTNFTTIDGEEFNGYLNAKYFGLLLERIIR